MWQRIWNAIKGAIVKLIGKRDIETALHITPTVSDAMREAIELWGTMYKGESEWLHEPTAENPVKIVSLGLPSFIASEKARMATLEMVSIITSPDTVPKDDDMNVDSKFEPKTRAEYLNKMYQLYLVPNIRRQLEYGVAKGGLVIKPYVFEGDKIAFTFCQADDFFPISFDSVGNMTEAAFTDVISAKDVVYTRLEYHKYDSETHTVTVVNKAYKRFLTNKLDSGNSDMLGIEVNLNSIEQWKDIAPQVVINNVDRLLFSYFRMPDANTVDSCSPLGVSAYSRAVTLIREADLQYSRMLWEYEGGQLAVDVDIEALKTTKDAKGNLIELPNMLQRRLFRKLDLGTEDTYKAFAPNLRDASYMSGLNNILMRIEDVCALSRGTMSDITRSEAKTATELLIMRQRSYSANADVQKALQKALQDTIYVMNVYCELYNLAPAGDYSVSFTWDDSLITSPEEELQRRLLLLHENIESRVAIRMWYYGETEDQAKKAIEDAVSEQSEVTKAVTPVQVEPSGLTTTGSRTPKSPDDTKKNIPNNQKDNTEEDK